MKQTKIIVVLMVTIAMLQLRAFSQEFTQSKNSVYLEIGGNGFIYSLNYDRIITLSSKLKLAPRLGIEYLPQDHDIKYNDINIPIELNILLGKNSASKNFFESGLGLNLFGIKKGYTINENNSIVDNGNGMAKVTTLRLGFRHQKPEGGLMYRAGILVKLTQDDFSKSRVGDDLFYRLWPGASIGYSF